MNYDRAITEKEFNGFKMAVKYLEQYAKDGAVENRWLACKPNRYAVKRLVYSRLKKLWVVGCSVSGVLRLPLTFLRLAHVAAYQH